MSQNVSNSDSVLLSARSFTVTTSAENDLVLAEEKERKEKTFSNALDCSNYTTAIVAAIGTILAAVAVYIGYTFQSNKQIVIQLNRFSEGDRITRLNNSFYAENKIIFAPKIKEPEFISAYTEVIMEMKQCSPEGNMLHLFYGESGIGKTTMLNEVLKDLKPYPYVLITLERGNSWKKVGQKLNITSMNEEATEMFIFGTLTDYFMGLNTEVCPLIILDGANRNSIITNTFIAFWRDIGPKRPFGLLMISSDRSISSINRGGGRVLETELSPSHTFVRAYLKDLGITNPAQVSEIMEITGRKIVFLKRLRTVDGFVKLNELEKIVKNNILVLLSNLRKKGSAFEHYKNLVKVLLEEPQKTREALDRVPGEVHETIFTSNLLKLLDDDDYEFQNKAIERFYKKKQLRKK